MRILHYLPGLPPVRGGGMVKYAIDLMNAQKEKNLVWIMTAGPISLKKKKRNRVCVKYVGRWNGVKQYEVKNSLPIPMANGICDTGWYTLKVDETVYLNFLKKITPDIIHVHSLMGLHREFLYAAEKCNIPVVYTTHDYFGICPKTDYMYGSEPCRYRGYGCRQCCKTAFSEKRILLEHSHVYKWYRNSNWMIQILKAASMRNAGKTLRSHMPEIQINKEKPEMQKDEAYEYLLEYYEEMFKKVSYFHFNSEMTRDIFENVLGPLNGMVIQVSNSLIEDHRTKHEYDGANLSIGFVGGDSPYKGLIPLCNIIQELRLEGIENIKLHVYGSTKKKGYDFVVYHDAYRSEDLESVYGAMDILVVPSIWNETFGMVVPEAISYGVPVLVRKNVGAVDIVKKAKKQIGIIVSDDLELKDKLRELAKNSAILQKMNINIIENDMKFVYEEHVKKMDELYKHVISKEG